MVGVNKEMTEKIRDKEEVHLNKEVKNNEVLASLDEVNAYLELAQNKQDIQKEFKVGHQLLEDKERELQNELQKLIKIKEDYRKWKDESKEKLDIQSEDFQTFERDYLS